VAGASAIPSSAASDTGSLPDSRLVRVVRARMARARRVSGSAPKPHL